MNPSSTAGPRRLDPRSILIRALTSAPSLIWAPLPVFLAIRRNVEAQGPVFLFGLIVAGLLVALAIGGVLAWVRWRAFTYEVLADQVVIAQGVFSRSRRSIPVERIEDVSITRGVLARILGLAEVRIETGGGEADEGRLDSVSLAQAYVLRDVLRAARSDRVATADIAPPDPDPEAEAGATAADTVVFQMGLGRLLLLGLFSFSLIWLAAILGGLQLLDQALGVGWRRWVDLAEAAGRDLRGRPDDWIGLGFGIVGLFVVLGFAAGVGRAVVRDWGFTLTMTPGRFHLRRGLLTRSEVVIARRRIQLGLVRRGWIRRRFGWAALQVQTLGGADQQTGRQDLAPFARHEEVARIVALSDLPPFDAVALTPVSSRHRVGALVGPILMVAAAIWVGVVYHPAGLLGLIPVVLGLWVAWRRPGRHAYGLGATAVQVCRGVLTRRDWVVPYGNIQVVSVRRGPLQALMGLATVRIDTAGARDLHRPHVHDLRTADAQALASALIARAAS